MFGIQTGVAIAFMVRREGSEGCTIHYVRRFAEKTAENKLSWLGDARIPDLAFDQSTPQPNGTWINIGEDTFQTLLSSANTKTKSASVLSQERAIFKLYSLGVIDRVLDQHKEKTPRDPTIRAKFNTYRFIDHEEEMIELLAKVVTVSIEMVAITDAMLHLERADLAQPI